MLAATRNASCLGRVRARRGGALRPGGDAVPMCQAGRPGSEVLRSLQVAAVLPLSARLVAACQPAPTPRPQALAPVPQTGARSHRDCCSRSWWQQHLGRGCRATFCALPALDLLAFVFHFFIFYFLPRGRPRTHGADPSPEVLRSSPNLD